jgi:Transposase DDE domain
MINLKYHQETITLMKGTTRNWSGYSVGLKNRGSLTFWVDEAVLESWYNETPSGKRGASKDYIYATMPSDLAEF